MKKRVLTIQDFSSVGKSSLTSALPIFNAVGIDIVGIPSAVLSSQTGETGNFVYTDLSDQILPSFEHIMSLGGSFDALIIGFLGNSKCIQSVAKIAKRLSKTGTKIIVDPVFGDNGQIYDIFDHDYAKEIAKLAKSADIIAPNFTESSIMAELEGIDNNRKNVDVIAKKLRQLGYGNIVITGVFDGCYASKNTSESDSENSADACPKKSETECDFDQNIAHKIGVYVDVEGSKFWISAPKYDVTLHGAGDLLLNVFVAKMLSGLSAKTAMVKSINFLNTVIKKSISEQVDLRHGLAFETCLHLLLD